MTTKLERFRAESGSNIAESIGRGRQAAPTPVLSIVPPKLQGLAKAKDAAVIPLAKIIPDPRQPRTEFEPESLGRLAQSLRARGQLQPIRVRWSEADGAYVVLCGERRWRAAGMAGMDALSCVIHDGELTETELLTIQLVENALREDLRPIEQARAYKSLMGANGWSTRKLSEEISVGQSAIAKALALLELPPAVQALVEGEKVSPATAYEVSKIPDPETQVEVARKVADEGLTRSDVEAIRKGRGVMPGESGAPTPGAPGPVIPRASARVKADAAPAPKVKVVNREWYTPEGAYVTVVLPADAASDNEVLDALRYVGSRLKTTRRRKP